MQGVTFGALPRPPRAPGEIEEAGNSRQTSIRWRRGGQQHLLAVTRKTPVDLEKSVKTAYDAARIAC